MKIIGLTGGIACGKTTVAAMLKELGATVLDADEISRGLTAPGGPALPAIREAFGPKVFLPDGTLDRKALAAIVFGNKAALETLNAITHPMVIARLESGIAACRESGASIVVLDVPLLFEVGAQRLADVTVCATAPEEVQILRMQSRNQYTREEALRRIRSQMPVAEKAARSDIVLDTDLPLPELEKEVETLYHLWLTAARKENQ